MRPRNNEKCKCPPHPSIYAAQWIDEDLQQRDHDMKNHLLPIAASALLLAGTTHAQNSCDSLQILAIQYAPFTDTAMQVIVLNNGEELFGYPQFSLIDVNGDTLVSEALNFFGIGWNTPSVHRMDLLPGMELPATPFTGTLMLQYFTGDGTPVCTFPIGNAPLCPQEECTPFQIYLYNNAPSIGLVTDVFPWTITNDEDVVVASGTLAIDAMDQQQDMVPACLASGEYVLHVEQSGSEGTTFSLGVTQSELMTNGPGATLDAGGAIELPFIYYPKCVELGMKIEEDALSTPLINVNNGMLRVTDRNGSALGTMMIMDAAGRSVQVVEALNSCIGIDLSNKAPGMYFVGSMDRKWPALKIVLAH